MALSSKELLANGVDPFIVRVRKRRRELHMRQAELAAVLDFAPSTVSHLETGKANITRATRAKLEAWLARWEGKTVNDNAQQPDLQGYAAHRASECEVEPGGRFEAPKSYARRPHHRKKTVTA